MIDYSHLVGIPFVEKGRNLSGMDCLGIAIALRNLVGKEMPDYEYDKIVPEEIDRAVPVLARKYNFVRIEEPQPYCIVSFIDVYPYSSHFGVVLEDCRSFLHSRSSGQGKSCIEKLDNPIWKNRRTGFWEIK